MDDKDQLASYRWLCFKLSLRIPCLSLVVVATDLRATFGEKRHELNVNTHQMCILMLFNNTDTLSFRDISEVCRIPDNELKRSLQSLACAKV